MGSKDQAGAAGGAESDLEMLSAWIDGELPPDQDEQLLARLQTDAALRTRLEWLHLVGDALRSHEVAACHGPALLDKVRQALAAEPVPPRPHPAGGHGLRWYAAVGLTLAAAAATVMIVALPQMRVAEPMSAGPVATAVQEGQMVAPAAPAAAEPVAVGGPASAASVTKPAGGLAGSSVPMDAYFRAHGEMAGAGMMPSAVAYIRLSSEPDR